MHPTGYRSRFEELSGWLELYADHPDAERVHDLALRRRPAGAPPPQGPVRGYLGGAGQELQERGAIRYRRALLALPRPTLWSEIGTTRSSSWRHRATRRGRARVAPPQIASLVDSRVRSGTLHIARRYLSSGDAPRALTLARAPPPGPQRACRSCMDRRAGRLAHRPDSSGGLALCSARECRPDRVLPARARPGGVLGSARVLSSACVPAGQPLLRIAASGRHFYGLLARATH